MATSVRRTNVKFCTEDGFCVDAVQCLAYVPPEHCVCLNFLQPNRHAHSNSDGDCTVFAHVRTVPIPDSIRIIPHATLERITTEVEASMLCTFAMASLCCSSHTV